MKDLGIKRKELDGGPCCPCDCSGDAKKKEAWENEVVHPQISAYGALAKVLPVEQMKPGVEYETTIRLRLSGVDGYGRKDGPTHVSVDVLAMGDLVGGEEDEDRPAVLRVMAKK